MGGVEPRRGPRECQEPRKALGVYIGILAVVLAVCSLGGSNADQDATQQSIAASMGLLPGKE